MTTGWRAWKNPGLADWLLVFVDWVSNRSEARPPFCAQTTRTGCCVNSNLPRRRRDVYLGSRIVTAAATA